MQGNAAVVAPPQTEEIHFHRGDVALCLLVNRRTRTLRIIDFRAGPSLLKREVVRRVAVQEGLERAFTITEREEAPAWVRLGFRKEASIPGFYKRTDGQLLGLQIDLDRGSAGHKRPFVWPLVSQQMVADRVERAYQAGRRLARTKAPGEFPQVKLQSAKEVDVQRCVASAARAERALTELEPFGRGGDRLSYLATGRGGFSLLISVECQPCFDNALVEVLTAPRSEKEAWLHAEALRQVSCVLEERGILSVFAIGVAESPEMTAAFVCAGYRRTGRLPRHLVAQGKRQDAFLWSRRRGDTEHG